MKTIQMKMDALMDARELKENLFQRLLMLKNEQLLCTSQWSDYKNECFDASVNAVEHAYQKACETVHYYETH